MSQSRNLAKNTLYLYCRLLVSMVITLYTSRLILQNLGIEDYGIYNAVGGVVAMFSIISSSLSVSISRNLTFELGKGDLDRLKKTFSMAINIQLMIIAVVCLLAETVGLWFLNYKMVIPSNRIVAANFVFQFSLLTFALNIFCVPFNASIIAHERMKTFAYIGILDVVLKLIVVVLLKWSVVDTLIYYGILLFLEALIIRLIYGIYCKRNFEECTYHFNKDRDVLKSLLGFATWNFIGSSSSILRSQGVNILLNLFFGPTVNAARAISVQVNTAVNSFVANFMTALTPQITKAYAQKNFEYLLMCIYRGSKFSYFLLLFLSLPVLVETEYILKLWLVNVPETTVWFVRFMIIFSLVDTYSRTLINANNATGDIKVYQLVIGSINLTVLPLVYLALKFGAPAESSVLVSVVVSLAGLFPRIYFNKKHIPVSFSCFTRQVIIPTALVSLISVLMPYVVMKNLPQNILSLVIVTILCFISVVLSIIFLGVTSEERNIAISFIKNKLKKDAN